MYRFIFRSGTKRTEQVTWKSVVARAIRHVCVSFSTSCCFFFFCFSSSSLFLFFGRFSFCHIHISSFSFAPIPFRFIFIFLGISDTHIYGPVLSRVFFFRLRVSFSTTFEFVTSPLYFVAFPFVDIRSLVHLFACRWNIVSLEEFMYTRLSYSIICRYVHGANGRACVCVFLALKNKIRLNTVAKPFSSHIFKCEHILTFCFVAIHFWTFRWAFAKYSTCAHTQA